MKFQTVLLLGCCLAVAATATPITLTFSGTGSGMVGATPFTGQTFTFIFHTDTNNIVNGDTSALPCCSQDLSTPITTTNTFSIGSITGMLNGFPAASATLPPQTPAVFVNPLEQDIGIWFYNEPDWLVTANPAFASYDLTTSIGPVMTQAFGNVAEGSPAMPSTAGNVSISSLSGVTFQAVVTPSTTPVGPSGPSGPITGGGGITAAISAVPEPSTFTLFGIGVACLLLGKIRRKAV